MDFTTRVAASTATQITNNDTLKQNNTSKKNIKPILINLKLYQGENPHAWQAALSGI